MKESIGKNISVRPNFTKFRCRIMPSKLFVVCMMRLIHINYAYLILLKFVRLQSQGLLKSFGQLIISACKYVQPIYTKCSRIALCVKIIIFFQYIQTKSQAVYLQLISISRILISRIQHGYVEVILKVPITYFYVIYPRYLEYL